MRTIDIIIGYIESVLGPAPLDKDGKKDIISLCWSQEEEDKLRDFIVALLENRKAMKDLTGRPVYGNSKKLRTKIANEFLFVYGPKVIY